MEIRLDSLNLTRSGSPVLRDVTWHVGTGERWWVLGANGAGKTQLLKLLAGDVWPDPAEPPTRRYRHRGHWHREPGEVKEHIAYLGPERQDRYERYGWNFPAWQVVATGLHRSDIPLEPFTPSQKRRSLALLERAGIVKLAQRPFLMLSYGERRLVLLARAIAWRPAALLLDEVATGLDVRHRRRLLQFLAKSRDRSSIWVSTAHRADDLPPEATHVLELAGGRIQSAGRLTVVRRRQLVAKHADPATRVTLRRSSPSREPSTLIALRNASVYFDGARILTALDLAVRRGECWVIHGANGSGKSTLLRTVYGDHGVASGGSIKRAGMTPGVPMEQFRARTGLIAPQLQTDYPRQHSVLETVVSGLHSSIGLNFAVTAGERRRARVVMRRYRLESFEDRPLGELSYGQVRRVLFARAAILKPRLLLLDEPFAGLDAETRRDLQHALDSEIADGLTVMLATHYQSEWPAGATHELQLAKGRIRYQGSVRR